MPPLFTFAAERKTEETEDALAPIYHLSRNGKNVVILFNERISYKNSEAQVVLPRLFADIGWQTIVTDPPNSDAGAVSFKNNRDLGFGSVTHSYYASYIVPPCVL